MATIHFVVKIMENTEIVSVWSNGEFGYRGNNWHFSTIDMVALTRNVIPLQHKQPNASCKNGEFPFGRIASNTTSRFVN